MGQESPTRLGWRDEKEVGVDWESEIGKAVAHVPLGTHSALVFFDTSSGQPVPKEVRITSSDVLPDLATALKGWQPTGSGALATSHLRNLNLGALQREWNVTYGQQDRSRRMSEGYKGEAYCTKCHRKSASDLKSVKKRGHFPPGHCPMCGLELPDDALDTGKPSEWTFRRPQDRQAAIERCAVAIRYEELTYQGKDNPTQVIAQEMFNGDIVRARNVVAAARQSDWLTPALPGRAFGEATAKALRFRADHEAEIAAQLGVIK